MQRQRSVAFIMAVFLNSRCRAFHRVVLCVDLKIRFFSDVTVAGCHISAEFDSSSRFQQFLAISASEPERAALCDTICVLYCQWILSASILVSFSWSFDGFVD